MGDPEVFYGCHRAAVARMVRLSYEDEVNECSFEEYYYEIDELYDDPYYVFEPDNVIYKWYIHSKVKERYKDITADYWLGYDRDDYYYCSNKNHNGDSGGDEC